MRIYFDYQAFTCFEYGGIVRYFRELVSNLAVVPDVEVTISSPLYSKAGCGLPDQIKKNMWFRIPKVKYAKGISLCINDYLYRASQMVCSSNKSADVLHQTFYFNRYKAKGVAVVQTVHDLIPEKFFGDVRHKSKLVKEADHVICVSEATKRDFLEYYNYAPENVSVVHHGVSRLSSLIDEQAKIPKKPYLLFVGRRVGYKNFNRLLKAYAGSKFLGNEFDLICFGGGPFDSDESELLRSNRLNLNQVRQVQGNDSLLATYYKHASLFVYPSLSEGFGLPLLEAMDTGCPVCCSDILCFREVAGEAVAYFDPSDAQSIKVAIESIISSKPKLEALKSKGFAQSKLYSWSKCANETLTVYKRLIG